MAETIASLLAELRRLHDVRERVAQRRLEDEDWAEVAALYSKAIEQSERGEDWEPAEVSDEETTPGTGSNGGSTPGSRCDDD